MYGIGPVRAKRIIAYRNSLGGFVTIDQYHEVYNLPEDVVQRLKKHTFVQDHFTPKQIDLNKASVSGLASHPYLTYEQAKAIRAYREQHGNFHTIEDLKKLQCLHKKEIKKLLRYLTVTKT